VRVLEARRLAERLGVAR